MANDKTGPFQTMDVVEGSTAAPVEVSDDLSMPEPSPNSASIPKPATTIASPAIASPGLVNGHGTAPGGSSSNAAPQNIHFSWL